MQNAEFLKRLPGGTHKMAEQIAGRLIDEGKIVEAGWRIYKALVLPANADDVQVSETRRAYFVGAQHLYASIMGALDPGTEPTLADLERMGKIDAELTVFADIELAKMGLRR